MENAMLILQKNAERNSNKIRLPKKVVETMGDKFYMEIYKDKLILKPIKKKGK